MKRTERCRQFGSIHHLTARRGFTLVEVLVVMAIMVILFGMLFVPISSSIDMARAGQARTQMQQHLQMAMEQINRGLANARYIYLPEYIPIANAPGDPDDTYLINYSNITFQPEGFSGTDAVRYAVMTQEYSFELIGGNYYCIPSPPEIDNPWILYRMEGDMRPIGGRNHFGGPGDANGDGVVDAGDATRDINEDGNIDVNDIHIVNYWSSRNALTPARNADIPVTRTICLDAVGYLVQPLGSTFLWAEGYVYHGDLDDNGTNDIEDVFGAAGVMLVYLHDDIRFGPLRVENERLAPTANQHQTTFVAEYSYWLGLQNNGSYTVGNAIWGIPLLINSSELRPRIVVRRWDGVTYEVMLDTDALKPSDPVPTPVDVGGVVIGNMFGTSWNSDQGTVILASAAGPAYADFDFTTIPGSHDTWQLSPASSTTDIAPVGGSDEYVEPITAQTTLTGASAGPSLPVASTSGFQPGDKVCVSQASGGEPNPAGNSEISTVQSVAANTLTLTLPLTYAYAAGDIVQAVLRDDGVPPTMRKAYSQYLVAPPLEAAIADKMVAPDSVRVRVTATRASGTASKEYRRVTFADPLNPNQDNIGPGQFAIQPAGTLTGGPDANDYSQAIIHFGNGEDGGNGVQTPPPSPDDPSTFGGTSTGWDVGALTAFWIEISYDVRRNFNTATLQNDQIDVSYSTRAIYNVSLELLPWRYYEDNDTDHIWTPYQRTKGVHLQEHIRIAALGG